MLEMDATMLLMNPALAYYQPYLVALPFLDPHCSIHWIEVSLRHESAGNNRANERLSRIRPRISDLSDDIRPLRHRCDRPMTPHDF